MVHRFMPHLTPHCSSSRRVPRQSADNFVEQPTYQRPADWSRFRLAIRKKLNQRRFGDRAPRQRLGTSVNALTTILPG
jgi:hypothetical protein